MKEELLPCPFCLSKHIQCHHTIEHNISVDRKENLHAIESELGFIVMCDDCLNQTMLWDKKQEAIKAWNTRKGDK